MGTASRIPARRRATVSAPDEELSQANAEAAVAYLLKQLVHTLRQAMDEALRAEQLALSFAHLGILHVLETDPGVPGAEIARRGSVTAQTMNALLRRLEEDGLIERQPNPNSARSDSWFVTPAGHRRLARGKQVGARVIKRLLAPLSEGEKTQFQDYLIRCITGMEMPEYSGPARATARKKTRR